MQRIGSNKFSFMRSEMIMLKLQQSSCIEKSLVIEFVLCCKYSSEIVFFLVLLAQQENESAKNGGMPSCCLPINVGLVLLIHYKSYVFGC